MKILKSSQDRILYLSILRAIPALFICMGILAIKLKGNLIVIEGWSISRSLLEITFLCAPLILLAVEIQMENMSLWDLGSGKMFRKSSPI
jgi:hypothetical protein